MRLINNSYTRNSFTKPYAVTTNEITLSVYGNTHRFLFTWWIFKRKTATATTTNKTIDRMKYNKTNRFCICITHRKDLMWYCQLKLIKICWDGKSNQFDFLWQFEMQDCALIFQWILFLSLFVDTFFFHSEKTLIVFRHFYSLSRLFIFIFLFSFFFNKEYGLSLIYLYSIFGSEWTCLLSLSCSIDL